VPNKISNLTSGVTTGQTSGTLAPSRDVALGASATPASGSAEVHITDTATQLVALEQTLRDSPAVDPLRVAQLSSAIEQGSYSVQPEHVATQLLQMEQALGGLPSEPEQGQ
jgi:negative regulator of flagellin synthesis FlgM